MSDTDLTPAELAAASAFRAAQRLQIGLAASADITVSVHIRQYRHECAARAGKSYFLELREHYAFSPEYEIQLPHAEVSDDDLEGAQLTAHYKIPARRFGFIWTQGRCPACQVTARSAAGRLVDPAVRPPAEHAVIA